MDRPTPLFPTQPLGCTPTRTERPPRLPSHEGALEAQVFASVDGVRDVSEIADSVELAPQEVLHVLLRLQMLGAVNLRDLDGGWDAA